MATKLEIQDRDIIKVGNHLIACGDIERDDGEQLLFRFGVPDLIYVDPPWGPGHYKFWFTHAHLKPTSNYDNFLHMLCRMFDLCKGEVFIEMGLRWEEVLTKHCQQFGGFIKGRWQITYQTKRPCLLFHYSFNDQLRNSHLNFSGLTDLKTPSLAIENYSKKGDIIFDPCMGKGTTARAAHKLNRIAYGLELNPLRCKITVDRLHKLGATPVKKIGSLEPNWEP